MAKKKKPIMAVLAVVLLAAGYKFGYPMIAGNAATPPGATATPTGPGPTFKMAERVLNVQTAETSPRYVKLGIAIEFENDDPTYSTLAGEALVKFEEEFATEFLPYQSALDDSVITIVSAKDFADLNSAVGKEKLRGELKKAFEEILGEEHKIKSVYFTGFVTQ